MSAPSRVAGGKRSVTAAHPAVELNDVAKQFGAAPALDGVTVACPAGRVTVVVGPSGCGKTTLLRCIAGLEDLDAGEIAIAGRPVSRVEAGQRGVAMVFQHYALYPAKTVAENIAFPLRMSRVGRAERCTRVTDAAELLRIGDLLDRRPHELSGGQRQRVGIARALVRNPSVLLMDEPLSNLDAALRTDMRAELRALQRRLGTSTVYVTHDQVEALTMADQLVVLRAGRLEQSGPPESVFATPATTFVAAFLGSMNLLSGRVTGGSLCCGNCAVDLPYDLPAQESRQITVGVRPEELRVGPATSGQLSLRADVALTELLGTERLVHLNAGDSTVRVRVPAATPLANQLELHADPAYVHYFDTDGRRLR